MTYGGYYDQHPPKLRQAVRRTEPASGVFVIHTFEAPPDLVMPDSGAEAGARFLANRTDRVAGYHAVGDSDSAVTMCDPLVWRTAHDATGTNRHSTGYSFYTHAHMWPALAGWADWAVEQAGRWHANQIERLFVETGVAVPRVRITATQARDRRPGFLAHADLDPARRTDPGAQFPWTDFFRAVDRHLFTPPPPTEVATMPYLLIRAALPEDNSSIFALFPGGDVRHIGGAEFSAYSAIHIVASADPGEIARLRAAAAT